MVTSVFPTQVPAMPGSRVADEEPQPATNPKDATHIALRIKFLRTSVVHLTQCTAGARETAATPSISKQVSAHLSGRHPSKRMPPTRAERRESTLARCESLARFTLRWVTTAPALCWLWRVGRPTDERREGLPSASRPLLSHCMCCPPLMAMLAPVTKAASSEHR